MNGSTILAALLASSSTLAAPPDCSAETAVDPGRWVVESRRTGEAPTRDRAEIVRLDGGCALVERLVLHFGDGSSHHVVFVQGGDAANDGWRQFLFGRGVGVWEWEIERIERGWLLTPTGTELAGRVRILERPADADTGFTKTVETLTDDGEWRVARVVRYVPW